MTDASEWKGKVGRKWANEWRRTDRSFSGLTERLLGRASGNGLSHVLDIGCGAGELSLAIARGHPQSQVIGIDISEDLLSVARERGAQLGNVTFEHGDAAAWCKDSFRPDRLISRHGVMFSPIPWLPSLIFMPYRQMMPGCFSPAFAHPPKTRGRAKSPRCNRGGSSRHPPVDRVHLLLPIKIVSMRS